MHGVTSRIVLFTLLCLDKSNVVCHCALRKRMSPAGDEPWPTALSSTLVGITAPACINGMWRRRMDVGGVNSLGVA